MLLGVLDLKPFPHLRLKHDRRFLLMPMLIKELEQNSTSFPLDSELINQQIVN